MIRCFASPSYPGRSLIAAAAATVVLVASPAAAHYSASGVGLGLAAGVSYSPTADNIGQSLSNTTQALNNSGGGPTNFSDVIGGGLRYDGDAGDFTYALSAVGTWGNSDDTTACAALAGGSNTGVCNFQTRDRDDLNAWNVGAKIGFAGFTLAANYYDDGGTGYRKIEQAQVDGYSVVGTYEFGPYKVGLNFMQMDIEHNALFAARTGFGTAGTPAAPISAVTAINTFAVPAGAPGVTGVRTVVDDYEMTGIGGGVGYQMAPGLKLYWDIGHFDYDTPVAAMNNSGIVSYAGVYVSF